MGNLCTSCGKSELKELVPGLQQCPLCKKIFRTAKVEEKKETISFDLQDGEYFMKNKLLNPKWEIADKGITVFREENKDWFAVLLCHSPNFPNSKYIRLSWWKKSINEHAGMFKIEDIKEAENVILALERIDESINDSFDFPNKIDESNHPNRPLSETEFNFDTKKHVCPKCNWKMKISKNHHYYECERCGEIIVLEGETPIIDIPHEKLPLNFSSNYPTNYYLPSYGITVRVGMAEWKAIVIIYAKENPERKWLRFYWWQRDLQQYIATQYSYNIGQGQSFKWEAKKGSLSPNIFDKKQIKPTIEAIKKIYKLWETLLPKEDNHK